MVFEYFPKIDFYDINDYEFAFVFFIFPLIAFFSENIDKFAYGSNFSLLQGSSLAIFDLFAVDVYMNIHKLS